jgi:hypothetical protein
MAIRPSLTFVLALVVTTTIASAQTSDETASANRSFREAKEAFARGDFTAAATAFEQAARTVPHAAPWLNASEAWEKRGEWVRSADDCDKALAIAKEDQYRVDARARLVRVLPHVGTLELSGERTITVTVDHDEAITLPARKRVSPGEHHLIATDLATNRTRAFDVSVDGGATTTLTVDLPSANNHVETPPPNVEKSGGPPVGTWVSFATAGAFAVATGVFGALTVQAQSDFNSAPSHTALDRFQLDRTLTNVFLGATVLAAAIGVIVWVVAPSKSTHKVGAIELRF